MSKKVLLSLMLLLFVVGLTACSAAEQYLVYVPNAGDGTVTVYDTSTQKVKQTISVGKTASHGVAVTPDNRYLYTGDLDGGNIYVVDTQTGKKVKTINVGERTHGVDISPDGKYVLVAAGRSGGPILAVIDTTTNEIAQTITEGMAGPTHMSFSPDGQRAYIADPVANGVIVVDMKTFKVEGVWDSGSEGAQETRPSSDGKYLYVANYEGGTIGVLDTGSGKLEKIIPTGEKTHAVAVSPDNRYIWVVAQGQGTVQVIDVEADYKVAQVIDVTPSPNHVSFTPDGQNVFITDSKENRVYIFNAKDYSELYHYDVGASPHEIDFVSVQ
ncbi:YncE family protein [Metallumcola ferriviriculae]|uniref:YncE family protein n=1 Tax=Metallumcola ferriviriculae TaxID=3039180 RepID=A0AAU0USW3_9FIRM|nr:YncE family protein [Desulfitibacteraceae bacterium MK1]